MSGPPDAAATFCATLVDQWVGDGVSRAMVSPGSRSTPIVVALARHRGIVIEVFHDERCAGFAALGASLATGSPTVVVCTSGTAAVHFHAAVVEADLSAVPLVVCTADRPPELRGRGAPQTIDQRHLYGTAVRAFLDPGVPDWSGADRWRELARTCVEAALGSDPGSVPGPVHLNLAFAEPLLGSPGAGPDPLGRAVRPRPHHLGDPVHLEQIASAISGRRGLVVAGDEAGRGALDLASALGWPVVADPRSGAWCDESHVVRHVDAIVRHDATAAALRPEVVIRLGAAPASKVLGQWIGAAASAGAAVVQVDEDGRLHDADATATQRVVWHIDDACRRLAAMVSPASPHWLESWMRASDTARAAIAGALEWGEPVAARTVVAGLPAGAHLVVSSSMPVRDVEWYAEPREALTIHSNRGANGIDGVISTAIGVACGSEAPTAVLVGDVAALHDSSALTGLARRGLDVRIVVVDNDGGAIFDFLPQAEQLEPDMFERLWGTPHGTSFRDLAEAHGLTHHEPTDAAQLAECIARPGPSLTVVRSSRPANVAQHRQLNSAVAAALRA